MNSIPHEFFIGGVYFPPLFISAIFASIVTHYTTKLFNRLGITQQLFYPPLVYVALVVIFTVIIGTIIIPS
jgi:hypothetical protein